jgi:Tol biopolymer transport system component
MKTAPHPLAGSVFLGTVILGLSLMATGSQFLLAQTPTAAVRSGLFPRSMASHALVALVRGSDRAQLTLAPLLSGSPAGAGTTGPIAFVSDRDFADGGGYEIYAMNADGSGATRLTNNPAYDAFPAWSPYGTQIAFVSNRDGNWEIYAMNADGTGVTRLTYSGPGWSFWPQWCGNRIAFHATRDGNADIYVMNADGTGVTRLTDDAATPQFPVWSPSCEQIAFPNAGEIYVMNADGTGVSRLTYHGARPQFMAWSPVGTQIAFSSYRDGNGEIYVINADGGGETRLTNDGGGGWNIPNDDHPTWSPDGTQITFDSTRDGNPEIYVMNADGTGATRSTNNLRNDYYPAWGLGAVAHIGNLNGTTSAPHGPTWSAIVEITAHDASHIPLSGASVTGTWSPNGLSSRCTTGDSGTQGLCRVQLDGIKKSVTSVTFTVSGVSIPWGTFDASANHDIDGSSNGTSVSTDRR